MRRFEPKARGVTSSVGVAALISVLIGTMPSPNIGDLPFAHGNKPISLRFFCALSAVAAETTETGSNLKKLADLQTAELPPVAQKPDEPLSSEAALENKVFDSVTKFIRENYPKAKVTRAGNKIHFEHRTRPNLNTLTKKTETIPDFGGVIGDLELKPGEYNGPVKLPQKYAEYAFYSVILMAPYVQSTNVHIYTRLAYPSDTPQDFTDQFESLMRSFADGTPPSALDLNGRNGHKLRTSDNPSTSSTPGSTPGVSSPSNSTSSPTSSSTPGSTQTGTSSPGQPPAVPAEERKLSFWKANKGNLVVYVFPVINYGKNRYFPLTGEIGKAFKVSSQIAVDSYMGLPSDPYSIGCYAGEDRLSKHISKPTRKSLEDLVEWTGEPIEIYDVWKPYFLTTGFDSSLIRQIGFNVLDLEKQVLKGTSRFGKRLIELEPALNRLSYFESLPESDQDLCARLALYDVLDYQNQQRKLEDAWILGDTNKSIEAAMSSTKNSPELIVAYNKLYQDCNAPLATAVEDALKRSSPIFVSLDLRRALGDKGLLKLLQAKGFQLTQVTGLMLTLEPGVVTELPYMEGEEGEVKAKSAK
ncbi:MAG: TraB/GumN family protein [Candidatus Melainabacteria bacterium]|nr:TraB/GumN family protein [Candidatus Melainabacteria bacterium]